MKPVISSIVVFSWHNHSIQLGNNRSKKTAIYLKDPSIA